MGIFLFEDMQRDFNKTVEAICAFLEVSPFKANKVNANPSLSGTSLWVVRVLNRIFKNNYGKSYFMPLTRSITTPGIEKEINYTIAGIEKRDSVRTFARSLRRIDEKWKLRKANRVYSEEWRDRIEKLYGPNNQKLMDETGLDLNQYNYPLVLSEIHGKENRS